MKKLINLLAVVSVTAALVPAVQAQKQDAVQTVSEPVSNIGEEKGITVNFDGREMSFDVEPMIKNDRIMVPFRAIFEALGCSVTYYKSDAGQVVTAKRGDDSLMLLIGDSLMSFAGEQITLDAPAMIANDRTLVPLRAVSEAFDASVSWDQASQTADIKQKQGEHQITSVSITDGITTDNGTSILNIFVSYPQIDNPDNSAYIDGLNSFYKTSAEEFVKAAVNMREKAVNIYNQQTKSVMPMEVSMTYTVDTDENGTLSITQHAYKYLVSEAGFSKASNTFDMVNETELALKDIPVTDMKNTAIGAFEKYYLENYKEAFTDAARNKLSEEIDAASFYLSEGKLVLYFNPGVILDDVILPQSVDLEYDREALKERLTAK